MNNRRGMWKMQAQVVDAQSKALSAPAQLIWARLPRPREIDAKNSFFGTHIQLSPYYIQMARAIGTRRVRLHDTSMLGKWPVAEVEPGQFRFYDEGVTAAHNGGLRILGMLDGAPAWTSTKPREGGYWGIWNIPDKPDALPQWERYVRTVAGHYKGRIDDWEIWNEPWGNWFQGAGGSAELFGQLTKIAYAAAKQGTRMPTSSASTPIVAMKIGLMRFSLMQGHSTSMASHFMTTTMRCMAVRRAYRRTTPRILRRYRKHTAHQSRCGTLKVDCSVWAVGMHPKPAV
jgi:hypothetical protein